MAHYKRISGLHRDLGFRGLGFEDLFKFQKGHIGTSWVAHSKHMSHRDVKPQHKAGDEMCRPVWQAMKLLKRGLGF